MAHHRDCCCKHCSTSSGKRTEDYPPNPTRQTGRVLQISPGDIFPILRVPARVAKSISRAIMPIFIRIEKTDGVKKYERGWNYVEARNGKLVMVRNKRDGFDIHRGGWTKTRPRERVVKEVYLVEPETDQRRGRARDGRVFIDVDTPRDHRSTIQVRRPIDTPSSRDYDAYELPSRDVYLDRANGHLVKKVPIEPGRLRRARPLDVMEEDTYYRDDCDYDRDEYYDASDMPARDARPYHIPDPEDSFWDDDHQAWIVNRKPRVRFE